MRCVSHVKGYRLFVSRMVFFLKLRDIMKNSVLMITMIVINVLLLIEIFVFSSRHNDLKQPNIYNSLEPIKHSFVHSNLTNGREIPNFELANLRNDPVLFHNFIGIKERSYWFTLK